MGDNNFDFFMQLSRQKMPLSKTAFWATFLFLFVKFRKCRLSPGLKSLSPGKNQTY